MVKKSGMMPSGKILVKVTEYNRRTGGPVRRLHMPGEFTFDHGLIALATVKGVREHECLILL